MDKPIEIKESHRGLDYIARVYTDPFTQKKSVEFVNAGNTFSDLGHFVCLSREYIGSEKNLKDKLSPGLALFYESNQDHGVRLCVKHFDGDVPTSKGDTLTLMFEDDAKIDLYLNDDDGTIILYDEDYKILSKKKPIIARYETSSCSGVYSFNERKGGDIFVQYTKFAFSIAHKTFGWKPEKKPILTPAFNSPSANYDEVADYCYVYLMLDCNTGLYKIGMSNNPEFREKTLQSEKPTISKIAEKKLPSRDFAAAIEKMVHNLYADKRVRGEWFNLSDYEIWQVKKFFE